MVKMVRVLCQCGEEMTFIDDDDRQYTSYEYYNCETCGRKKTRTIERDQNGLIIRDSLEDD